MRKRTKTILSVGAILLAGIVTVVGVGSSGFHNWDVKTWFKKEDQQTEQPTEDSYITGIGGAVVGEGEAEGIQLFSAVLPRSAYAANGISEQSEEAYVLTATIDPENATNQNLIWSMSWKNSHSSWVYTSQGQKVITDYMTITPEGNKATLTVLEAFGEQIIIKVASEEDETIFATCTVDYAQRVYLTNIAIGNVTLSYGNSQIPFVMGETGGRGGKMYVGAYPTPVYTLESNYTISVITSEVSFDPYGGAIYTGLSGENIYNEEIYFDLRFFDRFEYCYSTYNGEIVYSDSYRKNPKLCEPIEAVGKSFMKLTISIEDEYFFDSKSVNLVMGSYTVSVNSVNVDSSGIVV